MKKICCNILAMGVLIVLFFNASASASECNVRPLDDPGCNDYYFDNYNLTTSFDGACRKHDVCYSTIGKSKKSCDSKFGKNLRTSCRNKYDICAFNHCFVPIPLQPTYLACLATAQSYKAAVKNWGSGPYADAQKRTAKWIIKQDDPLCMAERAEEALVDDKIISNRLLHRGALGRFPTSSEAPASTDTKYDIAFKVSEKALLEADQIPGRMETNSWIFDEAGEEDPLDMEKAAAILSVLPL